MQVYDIIMIAVLVAAILFGAWKGLAWQVASLAAIFVSYFVALTFREPVAAFIQTEEPWNKFIAMFGLFTVTSLGIWIVFGYISKSIEKMQLKSFDRQAGAAVGAVKGALLCLVITFFAVTLLSNSQKQAICNSFSGKYIAQTIDKLHGVMPKEVHEVVHPYLEKMNDELNKEHDPNAPDDGLNLDKLIPDSVFARNEKNSTGIRNPASETTEASYDPTPVIDAVPIDPSKIDWRKIDWQRAAEAIGNRVEQNR